MKESVCSAASSEVSEVGKRCTEMTVTPASINRLARHLLPVPLTARSVSVIRSLAIVQGHCTPYKHQARLLCNKVTSEHHLNYSQYTASELLQLLLFNLL